VLPAGLVGGPPSGLQGSFEARLGTAARRMAAVSAQRACQLLR
jgi:hypothetical protein